MPVRQIDVFNPAVRQQLMAEQMMQTPAVDTSRWQGRITPAYGVGHGLLDAGQKLAGAWMAKKADKRMQVDEESRRKAQAAALSGLAQPPNAVETMATQNPYARAQTALNADVDPALVQAYMQQRMPQPAGGDPSKVAEYRFAQQNGFNGSFEEYLTQFYGREQNMPSSWLEWERFSGLTPQQQTQYLEMKRNVPIETVNQVPTRVLPGGQQQPLSTVQSEAQAAADIRGAETRAAEEARVGTEARADLPRVEQNATQIASVIDQLLQHPGFEGLFGASGVLQPQMVPGSPWADANALLDQIRGKTFLEAFQTLKGGGQITELEGTKAEQAIARLARTQSEEAARQALLELKEIAELGVQRAKQRAEIGQGLPQIVPPQQLQNEVQQRVRSYYE